MGNFLKKVWTVIAYCIPFKFKRLVVISTLYQTAIEQNLFGENERADFEKLNATLKIASSTSAIESALVLKDYVWGGRNLNAFVERFVAEDKQLSTIESVSLSKYIIKYVPCWLKYNESAMVSDISMILGSKPISIR